MRRKLVNLAKVFSMLLFVPTVGLLIVLAVHHGMLQLKVAFADEQVRVFEDMKQSASNTNDPHQIAGFLGYTVSYYPSGTKQVAGTPLDRIVEASRADAVATIIARFRLVTGRDLGGKPAPWLREYTPSSTPATHPN